MSRKNRTHKRLLELVLCIIDVLQDPVMLEPDLPVVPIVWPDTFGEGGMSATRAYERETER